MKKYSLLLLFFAIIMGGVFKNQEAQALTIILDSGRKHSAPPHHARPPHHRPPHHYQPPHYKPSPPTSYYVIPQRPGPIFLPPARPQHSPHYRPHPTPQNHGNGYRPSMPSPTHRPPHRP